MNNFFKKTVIRMSFESLVDQLKAELFKEGFEIGGVTDFQQTLSHPNGIAASKYQVISVYNAFLYREMLMLMPFDGILLPCNISVVERYPGETAVIPYNPTEMIVQSIENPSLRNLASEVTRRLDLAVTALKQEQSGMPDLVTSWG